MKIAVDIDEVLFEFIRGYMKFIEMKGHKIIEFEDIFSYPAMEPLKLSKTEAFELADDFHNSYFFEEGDLVEGAKDGVLKIKNHDLFFITSRPEYWKDKTYSFLEDNFGADKSRVYFSCDNLEEGKCKPEFCKELGVSVIIEDNGDFAKDCANAGLIVLLLDKPWNKEFSHKLIHRCFGWDGILSKIKELENV